tara:strand:- start:1766 stop:2065 length:300 start_codon:yes stop_codon:yes gene_type:complete
MSLENAIQSLEKAVENLTVELSKNNPIKPENIFEPTPKVRYKDIKNVTIGELKLLIKEKIDNGVSKERLKELIVSSGKDKIAELEKDEIDYVYKVIKAI